MDQDFFRDVPSEIMLDILSRLPTRSALICKCVCKPWLNLLTTPEFVKSHFSNSVPGLAISERSSNSKPYKIVEFVDEFDVNSDGHCWNITFNFNLPFLMSMHSSVNGLLLMGGSSPGNPYEFCLCNPITRDYIMLPSPEPVNLLTTFGFGVSKMSGQYKVVKIFDTERREALRKEEDDPLSCGKFDCQVYTVGSGSWRRICGSPLFYVIPATGAFLNGNLHWLASEECSRRISCLDLETELFSTFSPPPFDDRHSNKYLSILGECLCVSENTDDEIDIWLMKEYGDDESWTKEFVIANVDMTKEIVRSVRPIKVFKNGDILIELGSAKLLYYSTNTLTIRQDDLPESDRFRLSRTTIYTPSFLPLNTIATQDLSSSTPSTSSPLPIVSASAPPPPLTSTNMHFKSPTDD